MAGDSDVRAVLPALRVPTLLIHRTRDRGTDVGGARWMAGQIPDARLVELPGEDHLLWADPDPVFDLVEEFVTGVPAASVPDRVLLTIVCTDIVEATAQAAAVGDEQWRRTLDRHDELVERLLARYRGQRIKSTGDGVLVVFDGPARAVRWAQATITAMHELGLRIRAGVHTGEVK
jgi:class 3 adenylate cyclase